MFREKLDDISLLGHILKNDLKNGYPLNLGRESQGGRVQPRVRTDHAINQPLPRSMAKADFDRRKLHPGNDASRLRSR